MVRRLVGIIIVLSLVIFFLPAKIKFAITKYPRIVFLAPLNGINNFFANVRLNKKELHRLADLSTRLSLENIQLKEELQKINTSPKVFNLDVIPATIIARDNESGVRFLTINQGSKKNIKVNMPVVTAQGLVGKILAISEYQSIVETALSPSLKIAARNKRSRVNGIIEYSNLSNLRFKYTFAESDMQIGDTIVSSGLGGIFPRGINIGIVNNVETDPTRFFQYVETKPIVNFNTLEQVFVVISQISPDEERVNKNLNWETLQNLKIRIPIDPRIR